MAAGCVDRAARVFDLNAPFNQIAKTKSDTMPVSACVFYKSTHLFTAGTDNLKVWDLAADDIVMTDNIETSSKGILNMIVADKLQQIAFSSGTLSYHECYLSDVSFDGQYNYVPQPNNSIYNEHQSPSLRDVISRKGAMNSNNNGSTMAKRANSVQPNQPSINYLTDDKSKKIIDKKN